MSRLYLSREELKVSTLPQVCIRCGAPATVYQNKSFCWRRDPSVWFVGPAVLLLPFLLILLVAMLFLSLWDERVRILIPLCERCNRRARANRRFLFASLVGIPLLASAEHCAPGGRQRI